MTGPSNREMGLNETPWRVLDIVRFPSEAVPFTIRASQHHRLIWMTGRSVGQGEDSNETPYKVLDTDSPSKAVPFTIRASQHHRLLSVKASSDRGRWLKQNTLESVRQRFPLHSCPFHNKSAAASTVRIQNVCTSRTLRMQILDQS